MNQFLQTHQGHVAVYLGDVAAYSQTWIEHLDNVVMVLWSLQEAGLTTNQVKCHMYKTETIYPYLGYNLENGQKQPLVQGPGPVEVLNTEHQNPGMLISKICWVLLTVHTGTLINYRPLWRPSEGRPSAEGTADQRMYPGVLDVRGLPMPETSYL